jgi:hypothetical protein
MTPKPTNAHKYTEVYYTHRILYLAVNHCIVTSRYYFELRFFLIVQFRELDLLPASSLAEVQDYTRYQIIILPYMNVQFYLWGGVKLCLLQLRPVVHSHS